MTTAEKNRIAELQAAQVRNTPPGAATSQAVLDNTEQIEMRRAIASELFSMPEAEILEVIHAGGAISILDILGSELAAQALAQWCGRMSTETLGALLSHMISQFAGISADEAAALPPHEFASLAAMSIEAGHSGKWEITRH